MSKLDRIDKMERNYGVDQYGRSELNTLVMLKLTKNASKEDVILSSNFKLSMFKEAEKLKVQESLWRRQQSGHHSPHNLSDEAVSLTLPPKILERGDAKGHQSALAAMRSPSQGSLLGGDSSIYQTVDPGTIDGSEQDYQ